MARERTRGGWLLPIFLSFVLYTLSIGPAWRAWHAHVLDVDPAIIDAFYSPLERGAEYVGLYDELDAYMTWCDPPR